MAWSSNNNYMGLNLKVGFVKFTRGLLFNFYNSFNRKGGINYV